MYPSAAALITFCAPIEPPAPPTFSTITACPSALPIATLTLRAMTSESPPAGYGTTMDNGLEGNASCANAGRKDMLQKAASAILNSIFMGYS